MLRSDFMLTLLLTILISFYFKIMNTRRWENIKIVYIYSKIINFQRIRSPLRKLDFVAKNPNFNPVPDFYVTKHT